MPDPMPDPMPGPEPGPEPGPGRERPDARRRLRAGLTHPTRAQLVVAVLLAGLGFGAVTQVRTNDLDNTYAGYRQQDLIDLLNSLSVASQRAQREVARLERTRDELRSATSDEQAAVDAAARAADSLAILAGTVPVSGPGLRITITEEEGPIDLNHLLDTVQELRTAQAEAMEFDDSVRAVASTSFATGPEGVEVDGRPISSPYVIDVIGDPTTLEEGLKFPRGPLEQLREDDGASVEVTRLDNVEITSVVEAARPEYARPADGQ